MSKWGQLDEGDFWNTNWPEHWAIDFMNQTFVFLIPGVNRLVRKQNVVQLVLKHQTCWILKDFDPKVKCKEWVFWNVTRKLNFPWLWCPWKVSFPGGSADVGLNKKSRRPRHRLLRWMSRNPVMQRMQTAHAVLLRTPWLRRHRRRALQQQGRGVKTTPFKMRRPVPSLLFQRVHVVWALAPGRPQLSDVRPPNDSVSHGAAVT